MDLRIRAGLRRIDSGVRDYLQRFAAVLRHRKELQFARNLGVPTDGSWARDPSVFRKCPLGREYLRPLTDTGHYTRVVSSVDGARATMQGKNLVSFSRCDYLGLTSHPRVRQAVAEAIAQYGPSVSSSRLAAGTTELHNLLEQRMAEFIGGEACIVYIMGYLANLGVLPALVQSGEFLLVDKKSHNSLINACAIARQHGARVKIYGHNDMADLARKLRECGRESNKLIVSDAVFSMDGDLAPLDKMQQLARENNAGLFIDDAHGTGVVGATGRGTAEVFGLVGQIDLTMATLSKAFPAIGGCIIGKKEVVDYLKVTSDPYIFNLSLPPHMAVAALTALDIIKENPGLVLKLQENARYVKTELRRFGYDIGKAEAAIVPIFIRDDAKANQLTDMLEEAGFMVDPMVYPAVGRNEALIRLVVTAAHDPSDLARAVGVFEYAGRKLKII